MMLRLFHPIRSGIPLLLVLMLLLSAGCGSPPPNASVNGKVTSNGKPFDGKIVFTDGGSSKEQKTVEVTIQAGQYEVPEMTVGTKTINVFSSESADPKQGTHRQNGFWVSNPRTVEIQAGSQSIDFTVKRLAP